MLLHRFCIISIALLLSYSSMAQTVLSPEKILEARNQRRAFVDSLIRVQGGLSGDTKKVHLLMDLGFHLLEFSTDSAMYFIQQAEKLSIALGYPEGRCATIFKKGQVREYAGDRAGALNFYLEAISIAEEYDLYVYLHDLYSASFNSYYFQGNFPAALDIAQRGFSLAEKTKDPLRKLTYTNIIGNTHFRQGNIAEAEKYYLQALQAAENLNQPESIANSCINLAEVYIFRKDSAMMFRYINRSLSIYRDNFKSPAFVSRRHRYAFAISKAAEGFDALGYPDTALVLSLQALEVCQKQVSCDPFDLVNYNLLTGKLYLEHEDYQRAKEYFRNAMGVALQIGHKENSRDSYKALAQVFEFEKNYDSAYHYYKLYAGLKDEITNKESQTAIARIQGEYDLARKDRVIARQHNLRNIFIGVFILFILVAGFLYNRYRLRQHSRYQEQLNRQQNELFNAISLAQEQERKRIAQDIHDSLGSVLSAARLKMTELKDSQPQIANDEKFLAGISLLDEASSELRNISHNIMPATLSKLGLVPALKNLTEKISSAKGLQVQFFAYGLDNRLDEKTELSIYRIILELINNIVRHAGANSATIQLLKYPDYINITVEDDGRGFNEDYMKGERPGIGLGNISSRVEYLKGRMDIDSTPGIGTTVIIEIPLTD